MSTSFIFDWHVNHMSLIFHIMCRPIHWTNQLIWSSPTNNNKIASNYFEPQHILGQNSPASDPPTTTRRPRIRTTTARPARPILDGLSWLWRTWQETAPGAPQSGNRARPAVSGGGNRQLISSASQSPQQQQQQYDDDDGLDSDETAVSGFLLIIKGSLIIRERFCLKFLDFCVQKSVTKVLQSFMFKFRTDVMSINEQASCNTRQRPKAV